MKHGPEGVTLLPSGVPGLKQGKASLLGALGGD